MLVLVTPNTLFKSFLRKWHIDISPATHKSIYQTNLSVCLRTKGLWVRVQLQSFKQIVSLSQINFLYAY